MLTHIQDKCHIGCHIGVVLDSLIPYSPIPLHPAMALKASQQINEPQTQAHDLSIE
jgi:hypothetical protein